ncbi:hypothetical protein JHK85_051040 [Glycine max]|uniref:Uncharacterized protein n=1 Tax=Glycine soja TaxID=3848 RepID=A0A0B2PYP3_GLYSO|nr:hypothetical protein JHK85_051040 [Glycine max]KHN14431.1 hypothetical protein glysoja_041301 [Glycine soja]
MKNTKSTFIQKINAIMLTENILQHTTLKEAPCSFRCHVSIVRLDSTSLQTQQALHLPFLSNSR